MANFAYLPAELANAKSTFTMFDDFDWYISPHRWTATLTDSGTVTVTAGTTRVAIAMSDGTVADNDEAYLATTNANFAVAAGGNLYGEARIQFTEANTDDANIAFGFSSSVAANVIVDDGAGLRTTGTHFVIYKVDGGTAWICESRNGSTVSRNTSSTTAGGSAYQTLGVEIVELTSTTCTAVYKCDGVILRDATTGQPIRHQVLYSGLSNCQLWTGGKNGGANLETLNVEYMAAVQARS